MTELFRTPHGSHLYGMAHAGSDRDSFVVVEKVRRAKGKYAKQTIRDGDDVLVTDLPTFLRYADQGVPQYLEAMFSQQAEVDVIQALRASYRPSFAGAFQTYKRTARNFFEAGDFKRVRHSYRLGFNLQDMLFSGRFNPTMQAGEVEVLNQLAAEASREKLEQLLTF